MRLLIGINGLSLYGKTEIDRRETINESPLKDYEISNRDSDMNIIILNYILFSRYLLLNYSNSSIIKVILNFLKSGDSSGKCTIR